MDKNNLHSSKTETKMAFQIPLKKRPINIILATEIATQMETEKDIQNPKPKKLILRKSKVNVEPHRYFLRRKGESDKRTNSVVKDDPLSTDYIWKLIEKDMEDEDREVKKLKKCKLKNNLKEGKLRKRARKSETKLPQKCSINETYGTSNHEDVKNQSCKENIEHEADDQIVVNETGNSDSGLTLSVVENQNESSNALEIVINKSNHGSNTRIACPVPSNNCHDNETMVNNNLTSITTDHDKEETLSTSKKDDENASNSNLGIELLDTPTKEIIVGKEGTTTKTTTTTTTITELSFSIKPVHYSPVDSYSTELLRRKNKFLKFYRFVFDRDVEELINNMADVLQIVIKQARNYKYRLATLEKCTNEHIRRDEMINSAECFQKTIETHRKSFVAIIWEVHRRIRNRNFDSELNDDLFLAWFIKVYIRMNSIYKEFSHSLQETRMNVIALLPNDENTWSVLNFIVNSSDQRFLHECHCVQGFIEDAERLENDLEDTFCMRPVIKCSLKLSKLPDKLISNNFYRLEGHSKDTEDDITRACDSMEEEMFQTPNQEEDSSNN